MGAFQIDSKNNMVPMFGLHDHDSMVMMMMMMISSSSPPPPPSSKHHPIIRGWLCELCYSINPHLKPCFLKIRTPSCLSSLHQRSFIYATPSPFLFSQFLDLLLHGIGVVSIFYASLPESSRMAFRFLFPFFFSLFFPSTRATCKFPLTHSS